MTQDVTGDPYTAELLKHLQATRQAERDVFSRLEPAVRDRPMRDDDWSPKDHQAHLTMWKARQAERYEALREGREPLSDAREDDEINAELHATRADWDWDAIEREADEVSARLESEVRAADPAVFRDNERLVGSTFGNGPFHALTHFGWLIEANVGIDEERVDTFINHEEQLLEATGLPDRDRALGLYNLACAHALAGRPERARPLLREAFRFRPDLREWSTQDSDLDALRAELPSL